jgi:hypothetical protein
VYSGYVLENASARPMLRPGGPAEDSPGRKPWETDRPRPPFIPPPPRGGGGGQGEEVTGRPTAHAVGYIISPASRAAASGPEPFSRAFAERSAQGTPPGI